ncbi:Zn-dependent oligopeptidase [Flavobacterium restrictum]|uniref:Zn-dependent oligopeptidase n=1 Tax=Flavobacterium restrictum TaxID=2594428 RepID=A0A553E380_9FLAO|nr:Zn-dependent oligopeptidase [Flavobacterium restrictum]
MKKIIISSLLFLTQVGFAQNILLQHDNKAINFTKVTPATLQESVTLVIKSSDEKIKKITTVKTQTIANTLVAFDDLQYEITDLSMKLGLISSTYSDDAIRNMAYSESEKLSVYSSNLSLNEPLYKALKKFETSQKSKLSGAQKKFLSEAVISFEKNGMKLNSAQRKPLEALNKKLIELGNAFDKNIAESKDSLVFDANDLKGIDPETLLSWQRPNGKYVVVITGPNAITISENAANSTTRKKVYLHYKDRAYPQNIAVLDSLLYYRNAFAKTLGFSSYAAYALVDKMAEKPETVWSFENNLVTKITPLATQEVQTITNFKHEIDPNESPEFNAWDFGYYSKKMLTKNYQLNSDELKEYFEMNATLKGMFTVYESLLGIQIKPASNMPVWDAKVQTYEMWSEGHKIGSFYLDLFPRANKYTHFACFPISQYLKREANESLPQAALICNFPEGTTNTPSLLEHQNVVTLFHEFGHLVH